MKFRKITALLLVLCMLLSLSISAFAAEADEHTIYDSAPGEETALSTEAATSGTIQNSGIRWELDNKGWLTISGSGEAPVFQSADDQPWAEYREQITEVWYDDMSTLTISDLAYWFEGCVNLSGVMKIKVTVGYGESTVAKILALVESSGDAKAKTERFITKFSRIYTPAVCFFALALAIIPSLFDGNWTNWIYTALTFLVISCPCALVISVPLTFFSGIGGASKKGILIKGATYLETLAGLDTVVFDKTGTLTKGTFSVTGVHPAKGVTKDELLDAAAHAEAFSDHPIAISIKEALGRAVDMNRVSDASEAAGHGVQAKVDGQQVYAGNARLMESIGVKAAEPAEIGTVVHVARGGQYLGALVISDVIKENSASAMEALKSAGVKRLVMLTGDRREVAADIAKKVGLTDYRAELLPEDKVSALEGLLGDGHTVAFTGDGINDAPVLRRADIGIAMGGVGADAAIEAADIVLMDDDPAKIAQGVRHARRTMRIVHQNIIFALAVKLLVMVLGICGFANMWLAVFADVGVAMLAILNAMRAMKMKQ